MTVPPVLSRVVGQPAAVALLAGSVAAPLHAYLFLGPPGSGKDEAALAFAAALLCPAGGCGECASCHDALARRHPDLVVVEREGAAISVDAARNVARLAQRSPRAGSRQVLVLADFHLVDEAAPALLKTIEEPPAGTVFLVVADELARALVTIASRCVEVSFSSLGRGEIEAALLADGAEPDVAASVAAASAGRLDRARLLARDPGFALRQERWRSALGRLDGTGATVAVLAGELLASAEEVAAVARLAHEEEMAAAEAAAKAAGERGVPGRQAMEDRHKREQRRVRADELRAGLAALAQACRARAGDRAGERELAALSRRVAAIDAASRDLARNPNEALLLEALLLDLEDDA